MDSCSNRVGHFYAVVLGQMYQNRQEKLAYLQTYLLGYKPF